MKTGAAIIAAVMFCALSLQAQDTPTPVPNAAPGQSEAHHPPMPKDPKVAAALQECIGKASKDANGRANGKEVHACMEAKGFKPPMRGPQDPKVAAAIKECAEKASKDAEGRPVHAEMQACMQAKGFKPPVGGPHGGPDEHQPAAGEAQHQ